MSRTLTTKCIFILLAMILLTDPPAEASVVSTFTQITNDPEAFAGPDNNVPGDKNIAAINYSTTYSPTSSYVRYTYDESCNCNDIPVLDSGSATASLTLSQDLANGIISGSMSFNAAHQNQGGALVNQYLSAQFNVDTPYQFLFHAVLSGGPGASLTFTGNFADRTNTVQISGVDQPVNITESGIINSFPLGVFGVTITLVGGAKDNFFGASSGNGAFTLTLTPIPVPTAALLLSSAIAALGWLIRKPADLNFSRDLRTTGG